MPILATTGIVTCELTDAIGKHYSVRQYVVSGGGNTYDEMVGTANSEIHALDTLTEAVITRARLTIPLDVAGIKGSAVAGSEINVGARMRFEIGLKASAYGLWIPAWVRGNFVGDKAIIPSAYNDIARFSMSLSGSPPWYASDHYQPLSVEQDAYKSIREGAFGMLSAKYR